MLLFCYINLVKLEKLFNSPRFLEWLIIWDGGSICYQKLLEIDHTTPKKWPFTQSYIPLTHGMASPPFQFSLTCETRLSLLINLANSRCMWVSGYSSCSLHSCIPLLAFIILYKTSTVTILYLLFCFNIVMNDDHVNHVMRFPTWIEAPSDQVLKTFWMN